MICIRQRAARFRHGLWFAILVISSANPAYSATAPDVSFSPATLDFKYLVGNVLPAAQTLQIKSTGTALDYTLLVTGTAPNYMGQWLSISAASGTTPGTVKVYVNPFGLPSGNYSASIVVNAPKANTTSVIYSVTLEVGDPAPLLSVTTPDPSGSILFAFVTDGAVPAHKTMSVMSIGGALSASIALSGGTWLKATPTGNIALVGLPSAVDVSVDPTGLQPGSYSGKIVVSSTTASNKAITVPVTLTVSAGKPVVSSVWPIGAPVNTATNVTITITGSYFYPTSTATLGGKGFAVTYISPTTLMGTITPDLMANAGKQQIVVSTPTAASSSTDPTTFWVYPPGPQILSVANTASYTVNTISPGGIVTIYGINLGPAATPPALVTVFPGTDPIPTTLPASGGTSVTIDGNPAPILYTSPTQVSCIVPHAVSAKVKTPAITVNLVVNYVSASQPQAVTVVAADPGVFTTDASGAGQGAVLNINSITGNMTVNSATSPATKGSAVAIYITGFGTTQCVDGTAPNLCNPAATEANLVSGVVTPVLPVSVAIDGITAQLVGAGYQAPVGSVPGVLQINATVPAGVTARNTVPVVVTVGGFTSQGKVTMAVK
ncbi:MAG TPA: IPT/TIG domain-containing protein [Candidatus Acidoferrales bacterium]|nr:IPT/TIG domain-containing protein [Candidatus Acidoferrales bacterium]